VGIAVKNYDDTIAFYKSALGLQEAYALKTPDGGPLLTYLQVSRDTFPDPGLTPGKALISRIRDLDGVSIEVMEFGPESMQKKAMDAWRP